jgi:hypothetical protein
LSRALGRLGRDAGHEWPRFFQIVQRLLPGGTGDLADGAPNRIDWSVPPDWPPDLFAVAATLVNQSGCYAHFEVHSDVMERTLDRRSDNAETDEYRLEEWRSVRGDFNGLTYAPCMTKQLRELCDG